MTRIENLKATIIADLDKLSEDELEYIADRAWALKHGVSREPAPFDDEPTTERPLAAVLAHVGRMQ